jgi:tRNA-dihydrouridine synthase A
MSTHATMKVEEAPARRGVTRPLSVAPMMDRTDRHFRMLARAMTRHTLLYTEMVTAQAILHGDRERLLRYSPEERPLALQLGGDDPAALATCARIAEDLGYDEVNLNVGCPSDRVQNGAFGACLMARPERVADCVAAMRAAVALPITVKHRIGIDDIDSYEHMLAFVDTVAAAGCDRFSVHARKAWLKGLSPKENREIPPLRHPEVWRLKAERPWLAVEVNGGIVNLEQAGAHLAHVDAVMIGRGAYDDPHMLAGADAALFGDDRPKATRVEAALAMVPYLERLEAANERPSHALRHMLNLFAGVPGARAWRRLVAAAARREGGAGTAVRQALRAVTSEVP